MQRSAISPTPPSPLEPPGTIAVLGDRSTPFGEMTALEAALYGRYLGYRVTVFLSKEDGDGAAANRSNVPLAMLPSQSHSPLAAEAITAQTPDTPVPGPTTLGEFRDRVIVPLKRVDLLRDHFIDTPVQRIESAPVQPEADEDIDDVPPDFRLHFGDGDHATFEAVIVTGASPETMDWAIQPPTAYLFAIDIPMADISMTDASTTDAPATGVKGEIEAARSYAAMLQQIVQVFANLGDRDDLDLYRPRRM